MKKCLHKLIPLILISLVLYGAGRLYFQVTGGFAISNISSDFAYNPRWETHPLGADEKLLLDKALSQKYTYLGKGCQSYVFSSADGEYVIKFFKYQRYRFPFWLEPIVSLPIFQNYKQQKLAKKETKRDIFFESWRVAFDELKNETGIVYVHLNKTKDLNKEILIKDKIGMEHKVNLDDFEFLVQRKATMLCPTIEKLMQAGKSGDAKDLLSRLVAVIYSEYTRGFADHDHALMQNTGVYAGQPIHIDVGQFAKDDKVKDPAIYKQEIFNKTYKFRIWLEDTYPDLLKHLDKQLQEALGDDFYTLRHKPRK